MIRYKAVKEHSQVITKKLFSKVQSPSGFGSHFQQYHHCCSRPKTFNSPVHINKWVKQLKESAEEIFAGEIKSEDIKREKEIHDLHAKIGRLMVERDFLAQAWEKK